jgi:hypothetical protein
MAGPIFSHRNTHYDRQVAIMHKFRVIFLGIAILLMSVSGYAEEVSKEQIKGLDEQVQEIKSDVIAIAAELKHLEEKLLYPSGTQVAVFVSLAADDTFLLDSVEIGLDGEAVTHHLYSFKELEALRRGGVQRIYTGNISTGEHEVQVTLIGKSRGNDDFSNSQSFSIKKSVGPKVIEIALSDPDSAEEAIELKEL